MSLILEALRKSEAERRRGQAPNLYSDAPSARPTPNRSSPWPWLLAAAALLVAALGWWRGQSVPALPVAPIAPAVAPTQAPQTAASPPANPQAAPVAANAAPRFVAGPSAELKAPAASAVAVPSEPPTPTATSAADERNASDANVVVIAPVTTEVAAEPASNNQPELPALADLDSAQRAELPALKLSMHVWNAQPEQRFVILDGQRLGEGDRDGEAVVEAITRDGVILAWRSQRFRLARP